MANSAPTPLDPVAASASIAAVDVNQKTRKYAESMAGDWSDLPAGHVLLKMSAALPDIIKEAGYSEMYGVDLQVPAEGEKACPFTTLIILQKFLRANANNTQEASSQLTAALKWRKDFQPRKVMHEVFDKSRFGGLGYVVDLKGVPDSPNKSDVCAFNIYGGVKDMKKTFGDLEGFMKWRVALMELTLDHLHLRDAKKIIPDYTHGPDPYQALQVHDYLSVSFLRQPAEVKNASRETIQVFQQNYPETMSKKYFVNVPIFMQWMFSAMQLFMAKETIAKMKWMSYGTELYKDLGSSVPKAYGGSGPDLGVAGETTKFEGSGPSATTTDAQQATTTEAAAPTQSSTATAPVDASGPAAATEVVAPTPGVDATPEIAPVATDAPTVTGIQSS